MRHVLFVLAIVACGIVSCAEEQHPPPAEDVRREAAGGGTSSVADAGDGTTLETGVCWQARAESLPARLTAMSAKALPTATVVLVSDLFQRFVGVCGSCHGPSVDPPGLGGFQIRSPNDFMTEMTAKELEHVTSDVACPASLDPTNPKEPMPPCSSPNGGLYSQRSEGDPVKQFGELVQMWLAAGSPSAFTQASASGSAGDAGSDGGSVSPFALTAATGNAMTNVGDCVPNRALVAVEDRKSATLDAMFAALKAQPSGAGWQMIGLPEHLADTDIFTLDTQTLAQYGVIAYAPGYPLWSDNAGKLRYVRVPRGTAIRYDKTTQQFSIPPNTRFYKTFLKQVADTDGSLRYRKIETRIIVSRPDAANADGTNTPTALFGSYKWNDDESDAVLVQTPLNDGKPFADTLFEYNVDEPLAADILSGQPADPEEQLLEAHAARHYAIPSSDRCVQCHMGSPSASFVLGFTPLQINRRLPGTGGVIEPTGPDELTQLQRFIDYGLVTGIDSPADVVPLEQSQGGRAPRNEKELIAQGYLLGNCAHCHNPRGYPTVQNPVLKDVLNFLPGDTGGVFQFSLESYSPRIQRGASGSTPIPYITPSLMDLPTTNPGTESPSGDAFASGEQGDQGPVVDRIAYAPWRSLIYRNVDSAFAYTDDLALFPHMPMNTAGYDPRAKQIVSDWMVSIPAIRKHPETPEYTFYSGTDRDATAIGPGIPDATPQPYVEVTPGVPGYDVAAAAAQDRLAILHTGVNPALPLSSTAAASTGAYSRYADLGDTTDIVDPQVELDPVCHPIPTHESGSPFPFAEHPHWVVTDLSQLPGPWSPRRADWAQILVEQNIPPASSSCQSQVGEDAAHQDQLEAVGWLQTASLDQVRDYVTTAVPFGLWQRKTGCNFASVPTVASFATSQRPHWMDVVAPPADAPVYMQTPGAAVFKMICINCHGPKADAHGRMSDNLATMTGGLAVVADLRDGLFGPVGATSAMETNVHRIFGTLPPDAANNPQWAGATEDDRAARYMAWMGLGGTEVQIPQAILEIIAVTHVLDAQRVLNGSNLSANMLSQAKALCLSLLGPDLYPKGPTTFDPTDGHGYLDLNLNKPLIATNGDAELWLRLCSTANPLAVHVLDPTPNGNGWTLRVDPYFDGNFKVNIPFGRLIPAANYPAGVPVGNERGGVDVSLHASNEWPWCVNLESATADQTAWASSENLPVCPAPVINARKRCLQAAANDGASCWGEAEADRWAVRGAVNAGFAVFLYLNSIENGAALPDYNQCELLH